jgi:hypothetical protein
MAKKAPTQKRRHEKAALELAALEERNVPRNGRTVPVDRLEEQLARIDTDLETATSVKRVLLIQRRMDLEDRLASGGKDGYDNFEEAQLAFIKVAAAWAERKGLSYATLRQVGVPAGVLQAAGIRRGAMSGAGKRS